MVVLLSLLAVDQPLHIGQYIVRYPDRYMDEDRGREMFRCLMGILAEMKEITTQQLEADLATALPFTNRKI